MRRILEASLYRSINSFLLFLSHSYFVKMSRMMMLMILQTDFVLKTAFFCFTQSMEYLSGLAWTSNVFVFPPKWGDTWTGRLLAIASSCILWSKLFPLPTPPKSMTPAQQTDQSMREDVASHSGLAGEQGTQGMAQCVPRGFRDQSGLRAAVFMPCLSWEKRDMGQDELMGWSSRALLRFLWAMIGRNRTSTDRGSIPHITRCWGHRMPCLCSFLGACVMQNARLDGPFLWSSRSLLFLGPTEGYSSKDDCFECFIL